jgi:hypothetical protein
MYVAKVSFSYSGWIELGTGQIEDRCFSKMIEE